MRSHFVKLKKPSRKALKSQHKNKSLLATYFLELISDVCEYLSRLPRFVYQ